MPRESGTLSIRIVNDIATVPAADWDACAGDNPFVRHAFLAALEASGSAQPETGWAPHHLVVEGAGGAVRAAAPMYLKSHSYGEYVFDHGWAQAYERAGGQYYPKLLIAAPFTPVTGPRLLVPPGEGAEAIEQALAAGAIEVARRFEVSSLHINFVAEAVTQRLTAHGFLVRTGEQFHWVNGGYADFDDFLTALASRKCKIIRRERRAALDDGVSVEILSGSAIAERHWDAFFRFYMDTGGRKWGRPYLNRAFFSMLGAGMADRIVLVLARRSGEYIAGALNLRSSDTLYGRYWGCSEDRPFLHFELCYYQAIEYAIMHGIGRVEAGAQGPHKLQRGYGPVTTYSAHWLHDKGLHAAVARYLEAEREEVAAEIAWLADHTPFRRDAVPGAMVERGGRPEDESGE